MSQHHFKLLSLILPFVANFCITLNVYNGDILQIDENLEYLLWFLVPLIINILYDIFFYPSLKREPLVYKTCYIIWILGIISNVYWYYFSPFKIKDSIRHRTEYYATHSLLCSLLYVHIILIIIVKSSSSTIL